MYYSGKGPVVYEGKVEPVEQAPAGRAFVVYDGEVATIMLAPGTIVPDNWCDGRRLRITVETLP